MDRYNFMVYETGGCRKCRSRDITYQVAGNGQEESFIKCNACGVKANYSSAFRIYEIQPNGKEICPACGLAGKVHLKDYVYPFIELVCDCGHTDKIENFVGRECWQSFLADDDIEGDEY